MLTTPGSVTVRNLTSTIVRHDEGGDAMGDVCGRA